MIRLEAHQEVWPIKQPFRISRGSRTETQVVVVMVTDGQDTGRGEAVPIRRYGQTAESVLQQLDTLKNENALNRQSIQQSLPAGAARNALDCAFWDLEAKISGKRVWELANIPVVAEVETSFTISLDTPEVMANAARTNKERPILKLKLGGDEHDLSRVQGVRHGSPSARLIIDANESWSPEHYNKVVPGLKRLGVELIEQPFPAESDAVLESLAHPIPVCADESCHTSADLPRLLRRYEMINVKLDKTGGLTEALNLTRRAREAGFKLLFGCMVCTSLGIAPARLLAGPDDYVDLDGAILLARDREHGIPYTNEKMGLPSPELWG